MSRISEIKRQLEATYEAIERMDAERDAGTLDADEHARGRAEREREVGRLFVALRRTQRQTQARRDEAEAHDEGPMPARGATTVLRSPMVLLPAAALLVAAGVGGGVVAARWMAKPGAVASSGTPSGGPETVPAMPPAVVGDIELQALRQAAARDDAPTATLLQLGHGALDQGKLDEARRTYERVLAREPRNVEAITHVGAVLYQEGRVDEALAKIEEALRIEPRYVHAHWDRTQYLFHAKRDYPAAVKAAEAFLQVVPQGPDADNVRALLAEARQRSPTTPPGRR